jgi:hypothetical protein
VAKRLLRVIDKLGRDFVDGTETKGEEEGTGGLERWRGYRAQIVTIHEVERPETNGAAAPMPYREQEERAAPSGCRQGTPMCALPVNWVDFILVCVD